MTPPKPLARRDLRLRDSIRTDAGAELRDAAGGTKRVARLFGVSERWAREIVSGRAPSIVSQFLELVMSIRDPWKLVVLVKITAYQTTMMNESAAELVRKWREDVGECLEDASVVTTRLVGTRNGVDLVALEREARNAAQSMETLAARCRELRRSRIDPTEA